MRCIFIYIFDIILSLYILLFSFEFKFNLYVTCTLIFLFSTIYIIILNHKFKYNIAAYIAKIIFIPCIIMIIYYAYTNSIFLYAKGLAAMAEKCSEDFCVLFHDNTPPEFSAGTFSEFTVVATSSSFDGKAGEENLAKILSKYRNIESIIHLDSSHIAVISING